MPCTLVTDGNMGREMCDDNIGLSFEWWKVFAARLLFVVVFEVSFYGEKYCSSNKAAIYYNS